MTALTQVYNYNTPANFTYDNTKIQVTDHAELILQANPGQTFSQNYASSTGFTFNSSNTQFTAGVMRQINQAPATLAAYAAWDTFLNVNYGTDSLDVTASNGAAVSAGVLNLTGLTTKYVQLPSSYVIGSQGTIAFTYIPNYSGTPSANQIMYGNIGPNNYFGLFHLQSTGRFTVTLTNSTGTAIINANNFGVWSPVSGTHYTIVFQLDLINGATKLFINGVQFGSTVVTTGTRTASASAWVGSDGTPADGNANFSIGGFALYTSVVGPTGLTPLPDYNYNADTITLPTFTYPGVGSISAWTSTTITDTNAPQYTINGLYWNGSAWVASNLTFAQSNTASVISAHITTLPLSSTVNIKVYWTNIAQTPMSTALFTLTYTGQIYPINDPTIFPVLPLAIGSIVSFADTETIPSDSRVGWVLQIQGDSNYWYNGTAWAVSNMTYAQSNSTMQILANYSTFPNVPPGNIIFPIALLHTTSGLVTPQLMSLTIVYNPFIPAPTPPSQCIVYAFLTSLIGITPIAGAAQLIITNPNIVPYGLNLVRSGTSNIYCDLRGECQTSVIESVTNNFRYLFQIKYVDDNGVNQLSTLGWAQVPNQVTVDLSTLTFYRTADSSN